MIPALQEYRCECGKLLFKGFMLVSMVEIKCKRCNRVKAIAEINGGFIGPDSYAFLYAIDGTIINASSNASKLIGYSHHELLRMNLFQICQSYTPGIYQKLWQIFQEHRLPLTFDTFQKRKDGKIIHIYKQSKFFELGGRPYVFTVFSKPSSNESYSDSAVSFIQDPHDAVFVLNPQAVLTHVDAKVNSLLAYQEEDLLGKSWFEISKQQTSEHEAFSLMSKNRQSFDNKQNFIVSKKGKTLACESYFSSLYDQNGDFVGYRVFNWFIRPEVTNGHTNGFHKASPKIRTGLVMANVSLSPKI